MKTRVNRSDLFEKLGFQDKIFSKETIVFIPSKVLGDFKANKVRNDKNFEDCCHTITRSRLRSFSVIGDVYLTLFALKSPKNFVQLEGFLLQI